MNELKCFNRKTEHECIVYFTFLKTLTMVKATFIEITILQGWQKTYTCFIFKHFQPFPHLSANSHNGKKISQMGKDFQGQIKRRR